MSVTIKPTKPDLPAVVFDLDGFEDRSGGVGGWESLDRPRRSAAAGWVGEPSATIAIPLLLDGMEAGGVGIDRSVEPQCRKVESWGKAHRKTGQPPILSVRGLVTVSAKERWVVQDVTWGEYIASPAGHRVQQPLTLTLLRYVEPAIVKGPAAKARDRKKGKGKKDGKGGKGGKD